MFSKALTIFALVAAVLAAPSRPGGLSVSVKVPENVNSVDGLKVVASVTNSGQEDVTFINYGTVLDSKRPTQSFKVSKSGKEVQFTGIKMQLAMDKLPEDAFTTIKAGETLSLEHDISALYDFESAGAGSFDVSPLADIALVTARTAGRPELTPFIFDEAPSAAVKVSGDLAKRDLPGHQNAKRATVSCSNASQSSFISASYSEAKTLASRASSYIASNGANSLYTSYYKTSSTATVRGVFNGVSGESGSRTLSCTDPYGVCTGGVIAYTITSGQRNIYFCSIFFQEVASSRLCSGTTVASRNVRGGTTLHEITHAVSGTTDVGYGCSYDQGLSASNAVRNADNYNCFATQVYQTTGC